MDDEAEKVHVFLSKSLNYDKLMVICWENDVDAANFLWNNSKIKNRKIYSSVSFSTK